MENNDIKETKVNTVKIDGGKKTNTEIVDEDDYVYPNESFENGKVIVLDGAKLPKKW